MHWPDIHNVYRTCRYKLDYYLIEFRRKYYSNSRNPRVIQAKLKDQIILSLRTCPHDKYLVKQDEYLTLAEVGHELDPELGHHSVGSVVEMYLAETENPLLDLSDHSPGEEDDPQTAAELFTPITPATQITSPTPGSENRTESGLEEPNSGSEELKKHEEKTKPSLPDIQKVWAKLPFTSSRQTLKCKNAELTATNESVEAQDTSKWGKPTEGKMVWKTVLNDVSLSAARLSTGSDGGSKEDYESLTGDFIDSRRKVDLFVDNLAEGRAKFYGKS